MSRPSTPSVVPHGTETDVYLVLEDFGPRLGRAWCETDEEATDCATLIGDLLAGQYSSPVRIIAFNTAEGWSRDVTVDIADELRRRYVEHMICPDLCWNSWTPIGIEHPHQRACLWPVSNVRHGIKPPTFLLRERAVGESATNPRNILPPLQRLNCNIRWIAWRWKLQFVRSLRV